MEALFLVVILLGGLEFFLHLALGDWSKKFEEDNQDNPSVLYQIKTWIGKIMSILFLIFILFIAVNLIFDVPFWIKFFTKVFSQ